MGSLIDRSRPNPDDQPPDVFLHINEWLAKQSPTVQLEIFNVLARVKSALEYIYNVEECTRAVRVLVGALYDIVDFESIKRYVAFSPEINIPSTIVEEYNRQNQVSGTEGQTYDRRQYVDLISLSVALRLVYPVFVGFISAHARTLGIEYKEYQALSLLQESKLHTHPAMLKLRVYVETSLARGNPKHEAGISILGCGTGDFPEMGLAAIVVKKLCCCDIRGITPRSTPVSTMWQIIRALQEQRNTPPGSRIIPKGGNENGGDDDSSTLEGVKVRTSLSVMEQAAIHVQCEYWKLLRNKLNPELTDDNIEMLYNNIYHGFMTQNVIVQRGQIALLAWVLAPVLSPQALQHVDKNEMLRLMAIGTAHLWYLGYKHLAALLSATRIDSDDANYAVGFGSRTRVADDKVAALETLYAHIKPRDRADLKGKRQNPALTSVVSLSVLFSSVQWSFTLPPEMVAQLTGAANTKYFTAAPDLPNQLAQFVIDFNASYNTIAYRR
jgi:hypothetical protein